MLLIRLSNGRTLFVHLKMTGRFLLTPSGAAPTAHTRVLFRLSGGRDLHFDDTRKFGFMKLLDDEAAESLLAREGYGPEPLEKGFTSGIFSDCLRGPGPRRIKPKLINQQCIAGIGNIYADEALWRAKVRPDRLVDRLTDEETVALHRAVVDLLRLAIKRRGSSADSYVDLYGEKGKNVPHLRVYDRQGQPCLRCRTSIKKIR